MGLIVFLTIWHTKVAIKLCICNKIEKTANLHFTTLAN